MNRRTINLTYGTYVDTACIAIALGDVLHGPVSGLLIVGIEITGVDRAWLRLDYVGPHGPGRTVIPASGTARVASPASADDRQRVLAGAGLAPAIEPSRVAVGCLRRLKGMLS